MHNYHFASTGRLDIAYLEWNPQGARTAILLHGWPDSPECWKAVAPVLADAGCRLPGAGAGVARLHADPVP
ncbi:MAG: hypothetical protein ACN6OX_09070 [Pseudomonas sp.]